MALFSECIHSYAQIVIDTGLKQLLSSTVIAQISLGQRDLSFGAKSPLHSLTPKKAKRRRKVALSPP